MILNGWMNNLVKSESRMLDSILYLPLIYVNGKYIKNGMEVVLYAQRILKQLSYEDKFARKYACWASNHKGWKKHRRANRRTVRRRLKGMDIECQ